MRISVCLLLLCILFPVLAPVLVLTGCAVSRSPETHYHVLALPEDLGRRIGTRAITGPRVSVGPISLPAYLDRPSIFIRQGTSTDVRLAEYDRWGEDMAEGIARLLVEAMSARLAATGGAAWPLRAAGSVTGSMDRRVGVTINRFDGAPGATVMLDATWSLHTPEGDLLREGHVVDSAPAGADIDGLVRAHGELLARLGDILADILPDILPDTLGAIPAETSRAEALKSPARR
jgi:uncharacterized lipoprotein YmbA